MDIEMPVMNGYEATTAIREHEELLNRHTPIIGLSGNARCSQIQKALTVGMVSLRRGSVDSDALRKATKNNNRMTTSPSHLRETRSSRKYESTWKPKYRTLPTCWLLVIAIPHQHQQQTRTSPTTESQNLVQKERRWLDMLGWQGPFTPPKINERLRTVVVDDNDVWELYWLFLHRSRLLSSSHNIVPLHSTIFIVSFVSFVTFVTFVYSNIFVIKQPQSSLSFAAVTSYMYQYHSLVVTSLLITCLKSGYSKLRAGSFKGTFTM